MSEELETVAGYRIKGRRRLTHWAPLMEEWLLATERYCRIMCGEDAPYLYTERANIGILAGSAWRCGRVALEEFQHEKGLRTREKRNGRADLYLAWEEGEEFIEAKFGWLGLHLKPENQMARISSVLAEARLDGKHSIGKVPDTQGIAVAFLPCWQPSAEYDSLSENIRKTVRQIRSSRFGLVAWSFPKLGRNIEGKGGNNVLPGVVLIAETCSFEG